MIYKEKRAPAAHFRGLKSNKGRRVPSFAVSQPAASGGPPQP